MLNNKPLYLNLFTKTWGRDSHGLFDYESLQTKDLNVVVSDNLIITRKKNDIKLIKSFTDIMEDDELLLNLLHEPNNKYAINNPVGISMQPTEKNITELSNKIWFILNYNNSNKSTANHTCTNTNEDYYLKKNDIVKLGRVKYSLNEINLQGIEASSKPLSVCDSANYNVNEINSSTSPVFDFIFQAKSVENEHSDESMCKICYCNFNEEGNPLVNLCNCIGGIRFAHYFCIKKWMETKLSTKENEKKTVKSYSIRSFNCEICKTPYPFRFSLGNSTSLFDLIGIQVPENESYIVLESLNQVKDNCNIKSIHVITLTDDEVIIGRGHESDVRVNDISVSRTHGWLKFEKETGRLLLRDLKSKFGTLVLFKQPLEIKEKKIHLQIGRTYIEAKLIQSEEYEQINKEKKIKQAKPNNSNNNKEEGSKLTELQCSLNKDTPLTKEELLAFMNEKEDDE